MVAIDNKKRLKSSRALNDGIEGVCYKREYNGPVLVVGVAMERINIGKSTKEALCQSICVSIKTLVRAARGSCLCRTGRSDDFRKDCLEECSTLSLQRVRGGPWRKMACRKKL